MNSILITTYQNAYLVEKNIANFRKNFKNFKEVPIVVVYTSSQECGFKQLEEKCKDQKNITFYNFYNAPGSPKSTWIAPPQPDGSEYVSWRHRNIAPRILKSMEIGLDILDDFYDVDKVLHLHSDTFWRPDKENELLEYFDILSDKSIIVDLSEAEENCKSLPYGFHWHPEGTMLNLNKCYDLGYIFFSDIYCPKTEFKTHNYGSPEALLAQYFHFCCSFKNITSIDQTPDQRFYDEVYIRSVRPYHGSWDFGLINHQIIQPDEI